MAASILALHRRITRWPCGSWLFSKLACLKAPYFASISMWISPKPSRP